MWQSDYEQAIKQAGKYIIFVENGGSYNEIFKVFDTPAAAHEYASARIPHTKFNRIEIFETTGNPRTVRSGYTVRDDIKPYQQHHIGIAW